MDVSLWPESWGFLSKVTFQKCQTGLLPLACSSLITPACLRAPRQAACQELEIPCPAWPCDLLWLTECSRCDSLSIQARLPLFLAPHLLQRTSLARRHGVQCQTGPVVPAEDPDMEDQGEDQQSHLTNPQVAPCD